MSLQLVADIGGTNSRFALCETGSIALQEPRKYPNKDHATLQDVIAHYLSDVKASPTAACLAVAGPSHGDQVRLTNIDWSFSVSDVAQQFGFQPLVMANDFTALAMAVPHLDSSSYDKIGGGAASAKQPIAVVGPGTGLGVSALLWSGSQWVAVQGEGGNAGFAPSNTLEAELYQMATAEQGFVRSEDFVSGRGLTFLHDLLCERAGRPREGLKAPDITWRAKTSKDDPCYETVSIFCGMLGNIAGNMALAFGALGGVYIGGGVVPQLEQLFGDSPFRSNFEARGPFSDYVKAIPTFALHAHSRYALMGAAAILKQQMEPSA